MLVLRWSARLLSLCFAGLLSMFMFGGAEHLNATPREAVAMLFFPIGLVIGFGLAWWKPLVGAIVSLGSLLVFYGYMFASSGAFPGGPYFAVFALPAVLFFIDGWLQRNRRGEV